jgi:hypothetical protein
LVIKSLEPDPYPDLDSLEMLDPDSYPASMNLDPQLCWTQSIKYHLSGQNVEIELMRRPNGNIGAVDLPGVPLPLLGSALPAATQNEYIYENPATDLAHSRLRVLN